MTLKAILAFTICAVTIGLAVFLLLQGKHRK